jgi:hypothetical protein
MAAEVDSTSKIPSLQHLAAHAGCYLEHKKLLVATHENLSAFMIGETFAHESGHMMDNAINPFNPGLQLQFLAHVNSTSTHPKLDSSTVLEMAQRDISWLEQLIKAYKENKGSPEQMERVNTTRKHFKRFLEKAGLHILLPSPSSSLAPAHPVWDVLADLANSSKESSNTSLGINPTKQPNITNLESNSLLSSVLAQVYTALLGTIPELHPIV